MTSCADLPSDTSCHRFAHISTTDGQRAALRADRALWESLVNQMVAHNRAFASACEKD